MAQAAERGVRRIRVHALTDGRDTSVPSSKFFSDLVTDLEALKVHGCDGRIASGGGRMRVTMDRYEVCSASKPDIPGMKCPIQTTIKICANECSRTGTSSRGAMMRTS